MQDFINIFNLISFIGQVMFIGWLAYAAVRSVKAKPVQQQPVVAPKPRRQAPYQMVRYARSLNEIETRH